MALRENGLIPILVQLMNKAYQDSNTRHVQGGPAGYMVSKLLYIFVTCNKMSKNVQYLLKFNKDALQF